MWIYKLSVKQSDVFDLEAAQVCNSVDTTMVKIVTWSQAKSAFCKLDQDLDIFSMQSRCKWMLKWRSNNGHKSSSIADNRLTRQTDVPCIQPFAKSGGIALEIFTKTFQRHRSITLTFLCLQENISYLRKSWKKIDLLCSTLDWIWQTVAWKSDQSGIGYDLQTKDPLSQSKELKKKHTHTPGWANEKYHCSKSQILKIFLGPQKCMVVKNKAGKWFILLNGSQCGPLKKSMLASCRAKGKTVWLESRQALCIVLMTIEYNAARQFSKKKKIVHARFILVPIFLFCFHFYPCSFLWLQSKEREPSFSFFQLQNLPRPCTQNGQFRGLQLLFHGLVDTSFASTRVSATSPIWRLLHTAVQNAKWISFQHFAFPRTVRVSLSFHYPFRFQHHPTLYTRTELRSESWPKTFHILQSFSSERHWILLSSDPLVCLSRNRMLKFHSENKPEFFPDEMQEIRPLCRKIFVWFRQFHFFFLFFRIFFFFSLFFQNSHDKSNFATNVTESVFLMLSICCLIHGSCYLLQFNKSKLLCFAWTISFDCSIKCKIWTKAS